MGNDFGHRIERVERLVAAIALRIQHEDADGVRPKLPIEYYMVGEDPDQQATKNEVSALIKAIQQSGEPK